VLELGQRAQRKHEGEARAIEDGLDLAAVKVGHWKTSGWTGSPASWDMRIAHIILSIRGFYA
jgi:hypothetical protein